MQHGVRVTERPIDLCQAVICISDLKGPEKTLARILTPGVLPESLAGVDISSRTGPKRADERLKGSETDSKSPTLH